MATNTAQNVTPSRSSTLKLVNDIKSSNEDFEWYPTTPEIISAVKSHMMEFNKRWGVEYPSVLDCGAGDGRVLTELTKGSRYAIEKSNALLKSLDKDIFVVGTDFHSQCLIDKKVSVLFCNPPYSEFDVWADKIIREANASLAYLVIPKRWAESELIGAAVEARGIRTEVIGSFDFLDADRSARAVVDVVCVRFSYSKNFTGSDPFDLWFNTNFKLELDNREVSEYALKKSQEQRVANSIKNELVVGRDTIQVLEQLYQRDLAKLLGTYKSLESIDSVLMKEMGVNLESVKGGLRLKIEHLKDIYWQEYFNNFDRLTSRLTSKNRNHLLTRLTAHSHVDFSSENAYAVAIWAIKHANEYFDSQVVSVFEKMVEYANIRNYKSNQRAFGRHEWRWHNQTPDGLTHFKLDYRIVLERVGGIGGDKDGCGLAVDALTMLNDLRTVADNLGYSIEGYKSPAQLTWVSNKANVLHCTDKRSRLTKPLMDVKAFKNGNLHIKFDMDFIAALNVAHGKLKGWLRSPSEAAEELEIAIDDAESFFESNFKISGPSALLLGFDNKNVV